MSILSYQTRNIVVRLSKKIERTKNGRICVLNLISLLYQLKFF